MGKVYYVGIGGSPRDTWVEHEDFAAALEAAREMAVEMCDRTGDDPDSIDTWGEDDPDIGAGACPEGEPGGYWPQVTIEDDGLDYVVSYGSEADEWSRHASEDEAMAEARQLLDSGHGDVQVWGVDAYDGDGNVGPIWDSTR